MKIELKFIVHIVVSVTLIFVWFVEFGDESLRKYNAKAVIVTEHEEYLGYMPQPGMSHLNILSIYVDSLYNVL